jgi:hypothetical protein
MEWNLQLHLVVLIILRGNWKERKGSEESYLSKYNKKVKTWGISVLHI